MIYISGAITGIENYIDRFKEAENYLIQKYNRECFNPVRVCARHYARPENEKWETLMILLLNYLSRGCKSIYMLRGWEKSKGAQIEKLWAEKLGLEIMFEDKK